MGFDSDSTMRIVLHHRIVISFSNPLRQLLEKWEVIPILYMVDDRFTTKYHSIGQILSTHSFA
jgi:hypothetical protein